MKNLAGEDVTLPFPIKRKWVDALKSGEYIQGHGYLKQVNAEGHAAHCCLGVLCEILKEELTLKEEPDHVIGDLGQSVNFEESNIFLPQKVIKHIGADIASVNFESFVVENMENRVSLVDLNDGLNFSFSEIADLIEEHL